LAARAVLFFANAVLSPVQTASLLAIGTLAGEAPDIDLIFFYFNQRSATSKKMDSHRSYPTHAPMAWLIACLAVVLGGHIAGSAFAELVGWMILAGSWSHFTLDSIEYGIRWLWPFTNRRFCLKEVPEFVSDKPSGTLSYYWALVTTAYLKQITFYFEIAIVLAALWAAFR